MKIEQVWPEWTTERIIGKGSYGTVYKCSKVNNGLKEYAAIKVISVPKDEYEYSVVNSEGMSAEELKSYFNDIVEDFFNEVNLLESLKGVENVVSIEESKVIEHTDGIGWDIFIRMELLNDFNAYSADKKFSEADVVKLALDLSKALCVCAGRKIIHRDIKPENIFINNFGIYKLGDFGVAKQLEKTEASMSRKGTYNYMAPEVLSAKRYDSRADIYSLGIVMYKLLNNNRLPFLDPDKQLVRYSERQQAFERRINGEKITPINGVSERLNWLILKAVEFEPEKRFGSVEEFSYALQLLAEDMASASEKSREIIFPGSKVAVENISDKNPVDFSENEPTRMWNGGIKRKPAVINNNAEIIKPLPDVKKDKPKQNNKALKYVILGFIILCAVLFIILAVWGISDFFGLSLCISDSMMVICNEILIKYLM